MDAIAVFRKRLEEIYESNKKNDTFFEEIGIKKDNFRKLFSENGNPVLKTILSISAAANVQPGWLLGDTDTRELYGRIEGLENENARLRGELETADANAAIIQQLIGTKDELVRSYKERLEDKEKEIERLNNALSAMSRLTSSDKTETLKKGASATEHKNFL